ncbi:helix-turn-helix domain-containing protein [Listeria booriae]|uniref:Helix-turn-helix domain-containing protein n=1 Tax=Listeria booriae TaxID=1552123 RepID=A0A841Y2B7_9LIST|nr:helix-turn-helix domain-containing protein [Listeria booriae]MBC2676728.1 helix-turn-helix domain-containing protein [Listeria booriae]
MAKGAIKLNSYCFSLYYFLDKEFLSTQEAIDYLGISRQGFYSLVERGKITKVKKGSAVLYFRCEIEKQKKERKINRYRGR